MKKEELQSFIEKLVTAYDPDLLDTTFQDKVIAPLLTRFGGSPAEYSIEDFIASRLGQAYPQDDGDPFKSVVVDPLKLILEPIRRDIQSLYTAQSMTSADNLTTQEVDRLGANHFLSRKVGDVAAGTIRVYFRSPTTITFDDTAEFSTSGGLLFYPRSTTSLTSLEMTSNQEAGLYYMDVLARAEKAGDSYNVEANAITTLDGYPEVFKLANKASFYGGGNTETDAEYMLRIRSSLTNRSLVTPVGIRSTLLDTFSTEIDKVEVVGYGDDGMNRDIITGGEYGYPVSYGIAWVIGKYVLLLSTWVNRGANSLSISSGDKVSAYFHPWLFQNTAPPSQVLTVKDALYDSGPNNSSTLFMFTVEEDLVKTNGDTIPELGDFIFVPMLITKPKVLQLADSSDMLISDEEIHIGGHHDVWVRPSSYLSDTILFEKVLGGVYIGSGTDGVTNGTLEFTTSELLTNVRIGDTLYIMEGKSKGTYTILQVAVGSTSTTLYLNTVINYSENLLEFRIYNSVDIDIFGGKQIIYPVKSTDTAIINTVAGSDTLLSPVDLKGWNVKKDDVIELLDSINKGLYTIVSFIDDNGRRPQVTPALSHSSTATFQVYRPFPATVNTPLSTINKVSKDDITIPYKHPVMGKITHAGTPEFKASGTLGLALPNLSSYIDTAVDHYGKPDGWPDNWDFPPPDDWTTNSTPGTASDTPPSPNWFSGVWLPTSNEWPSVAPSAYTGNATSWPPNFTVRGKLTVPFEQTRNTPFSGTPIDPRDWGLFNVTPNDIVTDNVWSPLWEWDGRGSVRFSSTYSTGMRNTFGRIYAFKFDDGRQYEICLPEAAFDDKANIFLGLPEIPFDEITQWYNSGLVHADLTGNLEWYKSQRDNVSSPLPVDPASPYQDSDWDWGTNDANLPYMNPIFNFPDIPVPALCYAAPGDVLTLTSGANKGGYRIKNVHAYPINLGYIYPDVSAAVAKGSPGTQTAYEELIVWVGLAELSCEFTTNELSTAWDLLYNNSWNLLGYDLATAEGRFNFTNWLHFHRNFKGTDTRYFIGSGIPTAGTYPELFATYGDSAFTPIDYTDTPNIKTLLEANPASGKFDSHGIKDGSIIRTSDVSALGEHYKYAMLYAGISSSGITNIGLAKSRTVDGTYTRFKDTPIVSTLNSADSVRLRYNELLAQYDMFFIEHGATNVSIMRYYSTDLVSWSYDSTLLSKAVATTDITGFDIVDIDRRPVGGTIDSYLIVFLKDTSVSPAVYSVNTYSLSGATVTLITSESDLNINTLTPTTMIAIVGQSEKSFKLDAAPFSTDLLTQASGTTDMRSLTATSIARFVYPPSWEFTNGGRVHIGLSIPAGYTSVAFNSSYLFDPIDAIQDMLKVFPSIATGTAWDVIELGISFSKLIADWGIDQVSTFRDAIFNAYSVGTPAKGIARLYFTDPTTITAMSACSSPHYGLNTATKLNGYVDTGESVSFITDSTFNSYDVVLGNNLPLDITNLARDIVVAEEAYGKLHQSNNTDDTTLFQRGVIPELDRLELWHELPINWFNGPAVREDYTPVNSGVCGILLTAGSTKVVLPKGVSPRFMKGMVGCLLAIESGDSAGMYRVASWIDDSTITLDRAPISTTQSIIASGEVTLIDDATDKKIWCPWLSDLYVGKKVTIIGTPAGQWDDTYDIIASVWGIGPPAGYTVTVKSSETWITPHADPGVKAMAVVHEDDSTPAIAPFRIYNARPSLYSIIGVNPTLTMVDNYFEVVRINSSVDPRVAYVPAGIKMPYRIVRPGVQSISSTAMSENRDGMWYYFDVAVISSNADVVHNKTTGIQVMVEEGTYISDGFEHVIANKNFTYSPLEQGMLRVSADLLPVGENNAFGDKYQIVGGDVQVEYSWSPAARSVHDYITSVEYRDVNSSALGRTFMPMKVGTLINYNDGPDPSALVKDVANKIANANPTLGLAVSDIIQLILDKKATYIQYTDYMLWAVTEDLNRKRVGTIAQNKLDSYKFIEGSKYMVTYIPGQDVSGITEEAYPNGILLILNKGVLNA